MSFQRASGILLHPTSLPGPHGSGDLGISARHFVDWLVSAGQRLWQILPLGGIGPGNSPYMSSSAFAGNVLLVDLQELQMRGWLGAADLEPPAGGFAPHRRTSGKQSRSASAPPVAPLGTALRWRNARRTLASTVRVETGFGSFSWRTSLYR